jgi:hypothetical protein|tara:strand:+ start:571 stop:975 length:405 start_codon:yes stop_codon:yes gene_type:complete
MKQIILLLIIVSSIFRAQAQTKKDTIIALSNPFAKLVVADLVYGDSKVLEAEELSGLLTLTREKLEIKVQLVNTLEGKIENLQDKVEFKDTQQELAIELSEKLNKELKAEKRKSFFYKVGTGVGAVVTLILLVR